MREIKFRAWNEAENKMYSDIEDIRPRYKVHLMQFTGLKDKNGKEIYEGDILRIPFNDSIIDGLHEVYYYKEGYVTSWIMFSDKETANKNSLGWVINRGAEVIGNIYENPELLK